MAKKVNNGNNRTSSPAARSSPVAASTPVRNSSIPKPQPAKAQPKPVTHEMIAIRAYEISQSPLCGSEYDNWIRAEKELKGL